MLLESGEVTVEDVGSLATGDMNIGQNAASDGMLTVTGWNAMVNLRGSTNVGGSGTGALNLSGTYSYGNLVRVGQNSGGVGSVSMSNFSYFNLSNDLHVGLAGTGNLEVASGSYLSSLNGTLGYSSGGVGTATVSGAYSRWDISDRALIGLEGTGRLNVSDGGVVATGSDLIMGQQNSGVGELTLTDGGQVYVGRNSTIGLNGTGSVTVADGSRFTSNATWVGYLGGSQGTLTVRDGGAYDSTDDLYMGRDGQGTLDVSNGGSVTNRLSGLGWYAGSQGSATVSDAGSLWEMSSELIVGGGGYATLTVENGGEVRAAGDTTLARSSGSEGSATVTGSGSLLSVGAPLIVGREGNGTLTISDGGRVENTTSYVAYTYGSTSSATVEDGGTWAQSDDAYIGFGGDGALTVQSGGSVSSRDFTVGYHGAASGRAAFSGVGTELTASGRAYVGLWGQGELIAQDGAALSSLSASVAVQPGSVGSVVVSGAGTRWDTTEFFVVGRDGTGTALIEEGAQVTTGQGLIASNPTGTGHVLVTDAGTLWSTSGDLRLGPQGNGTLTVANAGLVDVGGDLLIGEFADSIATLNIGGVGGGSAQAAGTLDVGRAVFGNGAGTINFNHTDTNYQFSADVLGNGQINLLSGTTDLRGDMSGFDGLTTVTANAHLNLSQDLSLDDLLLNGGSAGFSSTAQTLTLRGSFSNAGEMDMRNATAGDQVNVAENYTGGGVIGVDVDFATDTADVLTVAGDISGAPTQLLIADVSSANATGNDVVIATALGQTQAGDFTLGQPITSGAFIYDLAFSGGNHVLAAGYQSGVSAIESLGAALFYHDSLPRLSERSAAVNNPHAVSLGDGVSLWTSITSAKRQFATESTTTGYEAEMEASGFRAGLSIDGGDIGAGRLSFGPYVGTGTSATTVTTTAGAENVALDSTSLGLTATWNHPSGFYIDGAMSASRFDGDVTAAGGNAQIEGRARSTGLEMGKTFSLSNGQWTVTPMARVEYAEVAYDAFTTSNGLAVADMKAHSLTASIGGRMEVAMAPPSGLDGTLKLYGSAFATRQFAGNLGSNVSGTSFETDLAPWTGEVTFGVTHDAGALGGVFVETTFSGNLDDPSQNAMTLRAGARFEF